MLRQLFRTIFDRRPRAPAGAAAHERERALGAALARAESEHGSGRLGAAIQSYEAALALGPPPGLAARILARIADLHNLAGDLHGAAACYERSLRADAGIAEVHYNHALLLCSLGRISGAEAGLRNAIELQPGFAAAQSALLGLQGLYRHEDPARVFAEHVAWARAHADPLTARAAPHANSLDTARRLSIGYVSGDFREHSMSYFIDPILANHDRERFRIVCYDNWPGEDAVNKRLRLHADEWRKIHNLDDEQADALIRADGIDILVDLSGHTTMNRLMLFARKPAPVQTTWLGYMCTTGMAAMDYRITDPYLDPPGTTELHYRERLARIPCCAAFCPSAESPEVNVLPALERGHVTFGSFNNYSKITDETVTAWGGILAGVPQARLVVAAQAGDDARVQGAIAERFARCGAPADRVSAVGRRPMHQFLRLVTEVDVALDPFPSSGGTTSLHTLWMGVPIVALEGSTELARATAGMLRGIALDRLVARSAGEYVEIAIGVGAAPAELARLRAALRPLMRQSAILDGQTVTRNLEEAYRGMWSRYVRDASRQTPPPRGNRT